MKKRKYATLKDIASYAGVTPATVSYVINGAKNRYISKELREKVEKAAKELHYVKSNAASSLKGKSSNIIAVLIPQFQNHFFTEMVLEIEKVFYEHGYILSICNTFDDPIREKDIIDKMERQRVDGYIIVPSEQGLETIKNLIAFGAPLVIADRDMPSLDCSCVLTQNYAGIELAVHTLIEKNHKNIAYIGWDADFGGIGERLAAFKNTMNNAGLDNYTITLGKFGYEEGFELTKKTLSENPSITAIIFGHNMQASGAIDYLASCNKEKEISIIILGHPSWAQTGNNNYTCIDLNGGQIGKRSAEILFQILSDSKTQTIREFAQCNYIDGNSVKINK